MPRIVDLLLLFGWSAFGGVRPANGLTNERARASTSGDERDRRVDPPGYSGETSSGETPFAGRSFFAHPCSPCLSLCIILIYFMYRRVFVTDIRIACVYVAREIDI